MPPLMPSTIFIVGQILRESGFVSQIVRLYVNALQQQYVLVKDVKYKERSDVELLAAVIGTGGAAADEAAAKGE